MSPQLGKIRNFVALVHNLAEVRSLWVPKGIHTGWCSLGSRFFRVPSALRFQEPKRALTTETPPEADLGMKMILRIIAALSKQQGLCDFHEPKGQSLGSFPQKTYHGTRLHCFKGTLIPWVLRSPTAPLKGSIFL